MADAAKAKPAHRPRHRPPAIAIVTMVYNEATNLPLWRDFYRAAAPGAALFVIDHGSDDGSTALAGTNRVPVPRRDMDEWPRTRFVRLFQASLLQYYDIVIYSDCDELIVVDPALSQTLEAYLATTEYDYASPIGMNVQHIIDVEPPLREGEGLLAQRRYAFFRSNMCKPLIARVRLAWEPGFHSCERPLHIDRNLFLFHIKTIDRDRAVARQAILQSVKWTQKAVETKQGAHHRFDDQRFLLTFFLNHARRFHRDGIAPWAFSAELERLSSGPKEPAFSGPIVEIPERFRQLF